MKNKFEKYSLPIALISMAILIFVLFNFFKEETIKVLNFILNIAFPILFFFGAVAVVYEIIFIGIYLTKEKKETDDKKKEEYVRICSDKAVAVWLGLFLITLLSIINEFFLTGPVILIGLSAQIAKIFAYVSSAVCVFASFVDFITIGAFIKEKEYLLAFESFCYFIGLAFLAIGLIF